MNVPEINYSISELLGEAKEKEKQPFRAILRDECKITRMDNFMYWLENTVKSIHKVHHEKFNEILENRI